MVKARIVTIDEIKKDNPRLCLSPLRYTDKCYGCKHYFKCESRIENKQFERNFKEYDILRKKLKIENKKLQQLKSKLEV